MTKRRKEKKAKGEGSVSGLRPWLWASIVLSLGGIGVSGYLAYHRIFGGSLVCTRWAQCDVVNNSLYAVLFGIPISFIGLAGYLALLGVAVAALSTSGKTQRLIVGAGFLMSLGGFGFSIWLTYVEVYIIEALCAWCLASAAIITLLVIVGGIGLWQSRGQTSS